MDTEDSNKERNIIYQIADENEYPRNTINKIENKVKYKIRTTQLRNNNYTNNNNNDNTKNGQLSCI